MRRHGVWDLLGWRGETVPVIQFETLNGGESRSVGGRGRCLLIMNRARRSNGRAFMVLASVGVPRIVHLTDDDLQNQAVKLGPAEVAALQVGTEIAVVPNLSFIEEQLATLRSALTARAARAYLTARSSATLAAISRSPPPAPCRRAESHRPESQRIAPRAIAAARSASLKPPSGPTSNNVSTASGGVSSGGGARDRAGKSGVRAAASSSPRSGIGAMQRGRCSRRHCSAALSNTRCQCVSRRPTRGPRSAPRCARVSISQMSVTPSSVAFCSTKSSRSPLISA